MKKKCKICNVTIGPENTYSGVPNRCKDCHKQKVRENRAANIDYYRAFDAKRHQNDPRVKERKRAYAKTDAGKAVAEKARMKWLENNADKRACHVILGNAVRDGRIIKPTSCSKCGADKCRIEGHHDDYSLPLAVQWLCRKCHYDIHNGES